MPSSPKPLLSTADRSVAGSARESASFQQNPDFAYVPGYSDKRRQMAAEAGRGRSPTTGVTHRLHWARHARPNGSPDGDVMGFLSRGYFRVTTDNYQSVGITELPITATVAADGSLHMGDLILLACPAESAQANEAQVRRAVDEQVSATGSALHSVGNELSRAGGLTTSESQSRLEITRPTP